MSKKSFEKLHSIQPRIGLGHDDLSVRRSLGALAKQLLVSVAG
jgi:hypothetical protein